ncbi:MAG: hypothetical protein WC356_01600 [Candidatus Micrarchaeia archaeon]|jgi:hypothetical protein
MNTTIHLSIDGGPEHILILGRTLTETEKRWLKQAACGVIRTLSTALEMNDSMRAFVSDGQGVTDREGQAVGESAKGAPAVQASIENNRGVVLWG